MPKVLKTRIRIGCAGWNIPRDAAVSFPEQGSHLQRYASRLNAVEINTSFYRPHRPATYARWSATVRADFSFSVKMPKHITHELRLHDVVEPLNQFLAETKSLGERLGCILVQLPPSLEFKQRIVGDFFEHLRDRYAGRLACEPRHASWFSHAAEELLRTNLVTRVAADPPPHPTAAEPAGFTDFRYFRLHGSPQIYYSRYSDAFLQSLARRIEAASAHCETWCIFDNTAAGHAADNALQMQALLANQS